VSGVVSLYCDVLPPLSLDELLLVELLSLDDEEERLLVVTGSMSGMVRVLLRGFLEGLG